MTRHSYISEAESQRINQAVSATEANTVGEIVTILADSSDGYADIALAWSAAIGLLGLIVIAAFSDFYLGTWDSLSGGWRQEWHPQQVLTFAAIVATLTFLGTWLILLWRPLRLLLVPRALRNQRVRARAVTCFKVGAERRTQGHTGILIYLSLAERRAEIVADAAIASKVPPEIWGDALAAMLAQIKDGHMADGLIAAIAGVGKVLAEHFPRDKNDVNELPDRLIEV